MQPSMYCIPRTERVRWILSAACTVVLCSLLLSLYLPREKQGKGTTPVDDTNAALNGTDDMSFNATNGTLNGIDGIPLNAINGTLNGSDAMPFNGTNATLNGNDGIPFNATLNGYDDIPFNATLDGNDGIPFNATLNGTVSCEEVGNSTAGCVEAGTPTIVPTWDGAVNQSEEQLRDEWHNPEDSFNSSGFRQAVEDVFLDQNLTDSGASAVAPLPFQ
ncbi:hypothetical protein R5R35_005411 [Gryllus longicercus]|uniref:Uncharacterized protein n=1 Tax=Gryllus longicercus TaxID=2509291 RepID=A0AAN9VII6_9ORTH